MNIYQHLSVLVLTHIGGIGRLISEAMWGRLGTERTILDTAVWIGFVFIGIVWALWARALRSKEEHPQRKRKNANERFDIYNVSIVVLLLLVFALIFYLNYIQMTK